MSFTPDLISTMSVYILGGFFYGFSGSANMKMVVDSANKADRARDMSLSRMGSSVGMILGSIISGVISQAIGFRPLFIISSVLYFCSAIIVLSINLRENQV